MIDLNATQAAIRAGYSKRTARSQGQRLLTHADIAARIEKRRAAQVSRTQITADFVLTELLKIATANGADFAAIDGRGHVKWTPTADLPPEKRAAVAGIKTGRDGTEIKTYDKMRALELLGKHLGLFQDSKATQAQSDGSSERMTGVIELPAVVPLTPPPDDQGEDTDAGNT